MRAGWLLNSPVAKEAPTEPVDCRCRFLQTRYSYGVLDDGGNCLLPVQNTGNAYWLLKCAVPTALSYAIVIIQRVETRGTKTQTGAPSKNKALPIARKG